MGGASEEISKSNLSKTQSSGMLDSQGSHKLEAKEPTALERVVQQAMKKFNEKASSDPEAKQEIVDIRERMIEILASNDDSAFVGGPRADKAQKQSILEKAEIVAKVFEKVINETIESSLSFSDFRGEISSKLTQK